MPLRRAEPDFSTLGKRLGKALAAVTTSVRAMDAAAILRYEADGHVTFGDVRLEAGDIKVREPPAPWAGAGLCVWHCMSISGMI
jgi:hypothetical protein